MDNCSAPADACNVFAISFPLELFLQGSVVYASQVLCLPPKLSPVPKSSWEITLKQCFTSPHGGEAQERC